MTPGGGERPPEGPKVTPKQKELMKQLDDPKNVDKASQHFLKKLDYKKPGDSNKNAAEKYIAAEQKNPLTKGANEIKKFLNAVPAFNSEKNGSMAFYKEDYAQKLDTHIKNYIASKKERAA